MPRAEENAKIVASPARCPVERIEAVGSTISASADVRRYPRLHDFETIATFTRARNMIRDQCVLHHHCISSGTPGDVRIRPLPSPPGEHEAGLRPSA